MSNTSIILSALDFDTQKQNLKNFLKGQDKFKDYNFDGSNMSVLLDLMSYNTYMNAFYLNMVASEMFMDSAQILDSVVSHAKELNYIPNSSRSSSITVDLEITTSNLDGVISIPKGTKFTGQNSNGSFTFVTNENKTYTSNNDVFTISNVELFEGKYMNDVYLMNYSIENQQFLINSSNADTDSLTVTVNENGTNTIFVQTLTTFENDASSNVYYLQAAQNGLFEINFANNDFGRKPLDNAIIFLNYLVNNGPDADGVQNVSISENLSESNPNGSVTSVAVTAAANSSGGSTYQNIDDIKFIAPRYFAAQQRAVTNEDYKALILSEFGNEIESVNVYGGEELQEKLYGRVVVTINPKNGVVASDILKNKITKYLKNYIAIPNRVVNKDPEFIKTYVDCYVEYDNTKTSKSASDIKSLVSNAIIEYSEDNLEDFGKDFRYSKLSTKIDNADPSITSNYTKVRIVKEISPASYVPTTYNIQLYNPIYFDASAFVDSVEHNKFHETQFDITESHASMFSSKFSFLASDGNIYDDCFFEDYDGVVKVYKNTSTGLLDLGNVGTIEYISGTINLINIKVSNYGEHIDIYFRTLNNDILADNNIINSIDRPRLNITVSETSR